MTSPPGPMALAVYVTDDVGFTIRLPVAITAPRPGSIWTFATDHGRLDVAFEPSGTVGYSDLRRSAEQTEIDGLTVLVASLADVIRSKEAADRPRDRAALPDLRSTLERKRLRERSP